MPVPEELKRRMQEELERGLKQVEDCPMTAGSLEPILNRTARRLSAIAAEGLTKAAAEKAAFSPSAVPSLRQGEDELPGPATARTDLRAWADGV